MYYHVEGTPAESFVDNIHRMVFDNWDEHEALYGDAPIVEMDYLEPDPVVRCQWRSAHASSTGQRQCQPCKRILPRKDVGIN